jgi:hypothetical protein
MVIDGLRENFGLFPFSSAKTLIKCLPVPPREAAASIIWLFLAVVL